MDPLVQSLILSLVLTEAYELMFCALVWRLRGRELAVCALVNAVTNPPVVLCYWLSKQWLAARGAAGYMPAVVAVLEISAVTVEWLFYRRCTNAKHPFLLSLTANAFSYGMGLLINLLINR